MTHPIFAATIDDANTVVSTAQRLADQPAQVLFFLMLFLLLGAGAFMLKKFIGYSERKDAQLADLASSSAKSNHELSISLDRLSSNVSDNTEILHAVKAKMNLGLALAMILLGPLLGTGCAKFSGYTEKELPDGTKEHVHFRGYTLFDGKAKLAQGRSFLGKTASVGVTESDLESSGESVVKAIEALPAAIKAAIVPTP